MGRQAHKAGLPAELPIMAALTESGLQNVNYGDRDSLGFFQMRTSIWNQGEYAGFSDHPELQLKWFIDHALAVRQERIAQGDTTYGQDSSKWGDWVADVEQPAAEYRGRYADASRRGRLSCSAPAERGGGAGGADRRRGGDAERVRGRRLGGRRPGAADRRALTWAPRTSGAARHPRPGSTARGSSSGATSSSGSTCRA